MSGGVYGGDEVGAIVFDIGHHSIRAGYAGEDSPKTEIPSVACIINNTTTPDTNGHTDINNQSTTTPRKEYHLGCCNIRVPRKGAEMQGFLKDGMIEDWDQFEATMDWLYKHHIHSEAMYHPVLMSEASWNTRNKREKLCELMFEKYDVPAFFLVKNAVLAAFANGRSTGLVLDSGASQTSAVPVHDGYVLTQAIVKSPLGGDFLSSQCLKYFEDKGVDIVPSYQIQSKETVKDNEPARWVKRPNLPEVTKSWFSYMQKEVISDFRHTILQVSDTTYEREVAEQMPTISYEFPNGYRRDFSSERFSIAETLFDPSMVKSLPPGSTMSLASMVTTSVGMCDVDARSSLYGSVIVTGGNTLLNGFVDRLTKDISTKTPSSMRLKVVQPQPGPERRFASWIGGSILASLGTFQQMWISKQEYDERGKAQVDKCP